MQDRERRWTPRTRAVHEQLAVAQAEGREVIVGNPDLPIHEHLPNIVEAIRDNQIVVIEAETGSGKTTQVPQALAAAGYKVEITQPRRLSAHELGARIADELTAAVPGLSRDVVGVLTGHENTLSNSTQITMATEGALLAAKYHSRQALDRPADPNVIMISDEAHEQGIEWEVHMALQLRQIKNDPNARLVVMTATLNKEHFLSRVQEITGVEPHVVSVPGRTYPVERIEEPGLSAAEAALKYQEPGACTLVFQPGLAEILATKRAIQVGMSKDQREHTTIYVIHSQASSPEEISAGCNRVPAPDETKIVIATNAAETGLTVSGIKYVVDDGTARESGLNKRGHEGLHIVHISQKRKTQRGGRAGRERPGFVIDVKPQRPLQYVAFEDREPFDTPEIHRVDLKNAALRFAMLGIDMRELDMVNPPKLSALERAYESLRIMGALDDEGNITDTGVDMSSYPVRAQLKRAITESKKYSREIQVVIAGMAAAVEAGGLPLYNRYASDGWKSLGSETSSDLIRQLELFIEARKLDPRGQNRLGLNPKRISEAEHTYGKILHHLGIDDALLEHPDDEQRDIMRRCIYAGYVERVFRHVGRGAYRLMSEPGMAADTTEFRISDRSVVDSRHAPLVVGEPYTIDRIKKGEIKEVAVIEGVTALPHLRELGDAAVNLANWGKEQVVWTSSGRAKLGRTERIYGQRTGRAHERLGGEDDLKQRIAELINRAYQQPGKAQIELRTIKKRLEELQHLAAGPITMMTQDAMGHLMREAAGRTTEFDIHYFDNELMQLIQEYGISLRTYITEEDELAIIANAPDQMNVNGDMLFIDYRMGVPKVHERDYDLEWAMAQRQDITLPDGRSVKFVYRKREYTILDLKAELVAEAGLQG